MNSNWITALRNAVSALAFASLFSPLTANAYTSNGSDGIFQPTYPVVLDLTQQIFNFTSIFIPNGVRVSFSGLASPQPIQFLATGDIYIAGLLDAGANDLWIETPGSLSVPGTLAAAGGALSLVANTISLSGTITTVGGDITLSGGIGGVRVGTGAILSAVGGDIPPRGGGLTITGGELIKGGGSGEIALSGGGDITIMDEAGCSGGCSIQLAVPEPEVWAMFLIGLCGMFAVSRLRNPNLRPA